MKLCFAISFAANERIIPKTLVQSTVSGKFQPNSRSTSHKIFSYQIKIIDILPSIYAVKSQITL